MASMTSRTYSTHHGVGVSSQELGMEGVLAGGYAARQHPAPRIVEKIRVGKRIDSG